MRRCLIAEARQFGRQDRAVNVLNFVGTAPVPMIAAAANHVRVSAQHARQQRQAAALRAQQKNRPIDWQVWRRKPASRVGHPTHRSQHIDQAVQSRRHRAAAPYHLALPRFVGDRHYAARRLRLDIPTSTTASITSAISLSVR